MQYNWEIYLKILSESWKKQIMKVREGEKRKVEEEDGFKYNYSNKGNFINRYRYKGGLLQFNFTALIFL